MMSENNFIEIKLILLGESGVGKTSIISRYVNDNFDPNVISSSTVSYVGKTIEKKNKKIKLNIWDTIGQEKFRAISKLFFKDTKIVILVYSITSQESFDNLNYWLNLYKDQLEEGTILGVAANKSDLFMDQKVSDEMGMEYAEENGAIFGLISAKENKVGLDKFIEKLVDAYLSKENINFNIKENKTIKLNNNKKVGKNNNSGGGCCSGGNNKIRQKKYENIVKNFKGCINSVFLGDKGVGKTSIINRLNGEKVKKDEKHTETINKFSFNYNNNEIKLKLITYDVDNDKMKTIEFIEIIKKSNIFFVVYDVNNKGSLENVGYWIEVIKKCKEDEIKQNYLLYIIGNKNDLYGKEDNEGEENKIIDNNNNHPKRRYIQEGKELSNKNDGIFKELSAMENRGIDNIIGESIEKYLCMK